MAVELFFIFIFFEIIGHSFGQIRKKKPCLSTWGEEDQKSPILRLSLKIFLCYPLLFFHSKVEDDILFNSGSQRDILFDASLKSGTRNDNSFDAPTYNSGLQDQSYNSGSRNPSYNSESQDPYYSGSSVAFTAVRAKSYSLSAPYFVAFEQTLTDKGYGWNPQTSTFEVRT